MLTQLEGPIIGSHPGVDAFAARVVAATLPKTHHASFPRILGANRNLRQVLDVAARVATTSATVLITGETGTGKELVAQGIHALSKRSAGPLICVNCGAIPTGLAEAELFGHERGAFTGAIDARAGRFESAHGGTIFLDEVGELPLDLQVKLLRVLQEREVQRVGSVRPRRVDVRIIAATNRRLSDEMRDGRFREDLYYRVATVEIELPSLRQRRDDLPVLAAHLLDRACHEFGRDLKGFTAEALAALCRYSWPGNVRELRNVIERAVLLADGDWIDAEDLPSVLPRQKRREFAGSLEATLRFEKRHLVEAALQFQPSGCRPRRRQPGSRKRRPCLHGCADADVSVRA